MKTQHYRTGDARRAAHATRPIMLEGCQFFRQRRVGSESQLNRIVARSSYSLSTVILAFASVAPSIRYR